MSAVPRKNDGQIYLGVQEVQDWEIAADISSRWNSSQFLIRLSHHRPPQRSRRACPCVGCRCPRSPGNQLNAAVYDRLSGGASDVDPHVEAVGLEMFLQELLLFVHQGTEGCCLFCCYREIVGDTTIWGN
jgi:hypothetical protein